MPSGTAQAMWMKEMRPTRLASEAARVTTSPLGKSRRAERSIRRYLRRIWVRNRALME